MKKVLYVVIGVVLACILGAVRTEPKVQVGTLQRTWQTVETCTHAASEAIALAVTERTFQTVLAAIVAAGDRTTLDGEIEWYIVPPSWNNVRFTAIGITADGTYTVDVFAGTLSSAVTNEDNLAAANAKLDDCNLTHIGTLAFVIGTQASTVSGYELADAVTVTNKDSTASWTSVSNAGDDTAEAKIDLQGANLLVIVPTTCSANAKLLVKGY